MDGFVAIGRAFNVVSLVIGILAGVALIAFGTYSIVENERPEAKPGKENLPSNFKAGLMIGFGLLIIPGAWRFYNRVKTDDRYATLAGFFDIQNFFSFLSRR